jgi:hypothetical protein
MQKHLESLATRSVDYPRTLTNHNRAFKNEKGERFDINPGTRFLWHPWALEAAVAKLGRDARLGTAAESRTRLRRSLGHLVVGLLSDLRAEIRSAKTETFVVSEMLFCLSSFPFSAEE